ncbi:uncharacterized protein F4812DRAFT_348307 [Daldinia caldariorum]|uniref:uncharacterized protein n=1 Tax=Daldinia caldariorum TaxID=326644 RepID=UPI002008DD43|nr:uncharacterized protein F4812DRAFT_348307 [Daldinia caldariorum]KAI1468839.1 hypothetical protein F4812DRAFT_348307 [Daldinia caldariorum]
MCTGTCWVYGCRRCGGTVHKDTSVAGHTCKTARRNRSRGCCRTGVEYTYYGKRSEELCAMCELVGEVEAYLSGGEMGGDVGGGGDEDEEGGASLSEGGEEEEEDGGGEEDRSDDDDDDDEEDPSAEDGGVKLSP